MVSIVPPSSVADKAASVIKHVVLPYEGQRLKALLGMTLPDQVIPHQAIDQVVLSVQKAVDEPTKMAHYVDAVTNVWASIGSALKSPFSQVAEGVSYVGQPQPLFDAVKQLSGGAIHLDEVLKAGSKEGMIDTLKAQAKAANLSVEPHSSASNRFTLQANDKMMDLTLGDHHASVFIDGQNHHVLPEPSQPGTYTVGTDHSIGMEGIELSSRIMRESGSNNPQTLLSHPDYQAHLAKIHPVLMDNATAAIPIFHQTAKDVIPTQTPVLEAIYTPVINLFKSLKPGTIPTQPEMQTIANEIVPIAKQQVEAFMHQPALNHEAGYEGLKTQLHEQTGLNLGQLYTPDHGFVGKDEAKKHLRSLLGQDNGWHAVENRPDRYVFQHPTQGYQLTVGVGPEGIGIHGLTTEKSQPMGGGLWHHVLTDEQNNPHVVNALATVAKQNVDALKQTPWFQAGKAMAANFQLTDLLARKEQAEAMLGIKIPTSLLNLEHPNGAGSIDTALGQHLNPNGVDSIINESKKDLN
jgi:hypothetical protein